MQEQHETIADHGADIEARSEIELRLLSLWADVLGVAGIDPYDNFFSRGGDSLKAAELTRQIDSQLQIHLDPLAIFTTPTVRGLASVLASASAETQSVLPPLRPGPRVTPLALTRSQAAWLDTDPIHLLEKRIPLARRLRGPLNVAAMERALHRLKNSHEILRTRYVVRESVTCQQIVDLELEPLQVVDLTEIAPAQRDKRLWEILYERFSKDITLEAPALELRVFRLERDDHYLAGFISRLVFDAKSEPIFWRELFEHYRLENSGASTVTRRPTLQFTDFANWESALLTAERLAQGTAFWRSHLTSAQPFRLPNAPGPMDQRSPWRVLPFGLEGADYSAVCEYAARSRVTLPILLLSSTAAAMAPWTGQYRSAIGSVLNGRPPQLADAIGCFTQVRPFFVDVSGDPSFAQLISRGSASYVAASRLSVPPPRELLEQLQVGRCIVNITSPEEEPHEESAAGLGFVVKQKSLSVPLKTAVSRDIALNMYYGRRALEGWIVYAAERITLLEAQRFVRNVVSIIRRGSMEADSPISTLLADAG